MKIYGIMIYGETYEHLKDAPAGRATQTLPRVHVPFGNVPALPTQFALKPDPPIP